MLIISASELSSIQIQVLPRANDKRRALTPGEQHDMRTNKR